MNGIEGYISIREASYRWGVSERRVNQYCAEGQIPARPVRALMGDPGKRGKAVRPALSGTAPRFRQDKHLTDTPLHFSIRKKEVNAMTCDESLYRQYLSGDDAGLEALMKKYGDPLTLYIDGYLHDVHEAEELMLDVFAYLFTKKPKIRDGGFKAYLYKAARHMALRHKSKRKPLFSLDALTDEPDGRLLAEEVIGRRSETASCTSAWTK